MKSFCVLESFTMYITLLILKIALQSWKRRYDYFCSPRKEAESTQGFKDISMSPDLVVKESTRMEGRNPFSLFLRLSTCTTMPPVMHFTTREKGRGSRRTPPPPPPNELYAFFHLEYWWSETQAKSRKQFQILQIRKEIKMIWPGHPVIWNCYWAGFLTSLINGKWSEARQEIQVSLFWGSCWSRVEQGQTTNSLACLLLEEAGVSWFLIWSEGRKGGQWGGLGVLPLGDFECMHRTLLLLLIPRFCSRLFESSSWVF